MNKKVLRHFQEVDPLLFSYFEKAGEIKLTKSDDFFESLCASIISQQLSVKAADTIYGRVIAQLPKKKVTPTTIIELDKEDARKAGMSYQKISYIKDLAQKVIEKEIHLESLEKLNDEAVIQELVKVKGIGRWTAEMFLMFALAREDIFSIGDLGLRNAIKKIYNLTNPTFEEIEQVSLKWAPYRTYACVVLWRSL
jgi:DNA-3-methyladenine glycosylase II